MQQELLPVEATLARIGELGDVDRNLDGVRYATDSRFGDRLTVATDGWVAIATDRPVSMPRKPLTIAFSVLLDLPFGWERRARVRDLVEWCGDVLWPAPGTCQECNGEPVVKCKKCSGHGSCLSCDQDCPECDDGERKCEFCEGTGTSAKVEPKANPGRLGDVAVNRVLLGRVLGAFDPRGDVSISGGPGELDPLVLWDGEDVVAFVMPMRVGSCSPRFEAWL